MAALRVRFHLQTVFYLCVFHFWMCIFNFGAVSHLAGGKMRGRPCHYRPLKGFLQQRPFSRALQLLPAPSNGSRSAQSLAICSSSLPGWWQRLRHSLCCSGASWLLTSDLLGGQQFSHGWLWRKKHLRVIILVVVIAPLLKHGWVGWGFIFPPLFSKVRVAPLELLAGGFKF